MDQLEYTYKNISFNNIIKAQFRKYLDKAYETHNLVVDISRSIENDILTIYKVHKTFFLKMFFVEKVEIDRKKKVYTSNITTRFYKENCVLSEEKDDVKYVQNFSVPFFMKDKKNKTFVAGCGIIEKIIEENNLRDKGI